MTFFRRRKPRPPSTHRSDVRTLNPAVVVLPPVDVPPLETYPDPPLFDAAFDIFDLSTAEGIEATFDVAFALDELEDSERVECWRSAAGAAMKGLFDGGHAA